MIIYYYAAIGNWNTQGFPQKGDGVEILGLWCIWGVIVFPLIKDLLRAWSFIYVLFSHVKQVIWQVKTSTSEKSGNLLKASQLAESQQNGEV